MRTWSSAGMGGGDRYGMGTSIHTRSHMVRRDSCGIFLYPL